MSEQHGRTAPPVLHNGDLLPAGEFLRRFERMPEVKKAELVDGIVFMDHRVCAAHGEASAALCHWLGLYSAATPLTRGSIRVTTLLDDDNVVQPDVTLAIKPSAGGRTSHSPDGFMVGGAELLADVALSSVNLDARVKPRLFARFGVPEYILWRVEDGAIDWWTLREGKYEAIDPDLADGLVKSVVYPGLWLDRAAMLRGDMPAVLAALQRGLASPGHVEFVTRLAATA